MHIHMHTPHCMHIACTDRHCMFACMSYPHICTLHRDTLPHTPTYAHYTETPTHTNYPSFPAHTHICPNTLVIYIKAYHVPIDRPGARIDFGVVQDSSKVDLFEPKSGLFEPHPLNPPTKKKKTFLTHFVTES